MTVSYFLLVALLYSQKGACDSSELVYEMTLDEIGKSDLIFFHNYRRATVFPPATNMVMLEWDDELANEASKNCAFQHSDPPLLSSKYGQLGENLYAGDEFRFSDIPFGVTDAWYNEVNFYDMNRNPTCLPGKECGHYTHLVWASTTHVGCAVSVCNHIYKGHGRTLVACMYGPSGNDYTSDMTQVPPYKVGAPCTDCPGNLPWCVAGLCHA